MDSLKIYTSRPYYPPERELAQVSLRIVRAIHATIERVSKAPNAKTFPWHSYFTGPGSGDAWVDFVHEVRAAGYRTPEDAERDLGPAGFLTILDRTIATLTPLASEVNESGG